MLRCAWQHHQTRVRAPLLGECHAVRGWLPTSPMWPLRARWLTFAFDATASAPLDFASPLPNFWLRGAAALYLLQL